MQKIIVAQHGKNPNITSEFIERHIDEDWDWKALSHNPNLTMEFVTKYKNNWDYNELARNRNIIDNEYDRKKKQIDNEILM